MKKQEHGQVLPLGLVLIVVCMIGAFVLFNTSKVATDKMRLANSADAAAYSGALWQARAMNYQAYSNRAMVANQVAIAQAVSLNSWVNYASFVSSNVASMLSLIPVPAITAIANGIDSGVNTADQAVDGMAAALVLASDSVIEVLSHSQQLMYLATFASAWEVIDVVAKETDSRFTTHSNYGNVAKGSNFYQWYAFNSQYTQRDTREMQERRDIINSSRDGFTRARNWDFLGSWIPVVPINRNLKISRQGATELVSVNTAQGQEWEWVAKDTMSLHSKKIIYAPWRGSGRTETPLAWASAFANTTNHTSYISPQCGSYSLLVLSNDGCMTLTDNNHKAERNAARGIRSLRGRTPLDNMRGYGGIRNYRGLSDSAREQDDARMTVLVEVSLPVEDVKESDTVLPSSRSNVPIAVAGSVLSSLSSADVFYRHPEYHSMDEGNRERANEYNPYWQAQLSPVSVEERFAASIVRPDLRKSMSRYGEFADRDNPSLLNHLNTGDDIPGEAMGSLLHYVD